MASPLAVIGRGAVAGYAGMGAMAAVVVAVKRVRGTRSGSPRTWREAQPPAEFAHRVITGVARRDVSIERAPLLNNLMHLIYAPVLGGWYAVVHESARPRTAWHGLAFGAAVWTLRLALLPTLKLDRPFWEYPPAEVAVDASFHLAFGLAVALAYRTLEPDAQLA